MQKQESAGDDHQQSACDLLFVGEADISIIIKGQHLTGKTHVSACILPLLATQPRQSDRCTVAHCPKTKIPNRVTPYCSRIRQVRWKANES